jgi:hypothetical protein
MTLLDLYGDDYLDDVEDLEPFRLSDGLRQALREDYGAASDEEMEDALESMLESLSPAESFNFASAINQIGRSAGQVLSDPTFGAVARTALPVAGGALGTVIGGPVGTALGSQLGNLAAGALPTRVAARPSSPMAAPPRPPSAPTAVPTAIVPAVAPVSPVAGGSAAAAQGLVLTQQPQVLQSLLSTALGQHGRQQVAGIPNAQLLAMLSQIFGQAAADADELMYIGYEGEVEEEGWGASSSGVDRSLYTGLIDADNLELAEALGEDVD